jgi:hypothetical protein
LAAEFRCLSCTVRSHSVTSNFFPELIYVLTAGEPCHWMNLQARYDLETWKDRLGAALDDLPIFGARNWLNVYILMLMILRTAI